MQRCQELRDAWIGFDGLAQAVVPCVACDGARRHRRLSRVQRPWAIADARLRIRLLTCEEESRRASSDMCEQGVPHVREHEIGDVVEVYHLYRWASKVPFIPLAFYFSPPGVERLASLIAPALIPLLADNRQ